MSGILRGRPGLWASLRDGVLASGVFFGLFSLPFVPFLGEIPSIFQALREFAVGRSFNGPVYDLLHRALDLGRPVASWITTLSFALVLAWRFFRY